MIYWLVGIILVITTLLLLLEIKSRRNYSRNLYIDPDTNETKVIPYRDPLRNQLVGIHRMFTGKLRGKESLKLTRRDVSRDLNGSTKHRLLQNSFLNFHFILIWDADVARTVMFAKDTELGKPNFGGAQERLVGASILLSTGEVWKTHKTALSPAFKWAHIREVMPCFVGIVSELSEHLSKVGKEVEIYPWIQNATLDAIGRGGFGYEFGAMRGDENKSQEIKDYEALMKELENPVHFFGKLSKLTGRSKIMANLFNKFEDFMANLIQKKRESVANMEEDWKPKGILDFLVYSKDGEQLSDKEILRNMNTFFVAGHETTAGALSNAIHLLAENPECQRKAREEVLSVCGTNNPTYDDIQKMEYVHNCIKETLRKCPPAVGVIRSVERDQQVGNLYLTKGALAFVQIYLIHHDPAYWGEDVDSFKPGRFDAEHSKSRHRYAWMPFSIGPRQCIGNNFAMLEMRSFLAVLLQKFEFLPNPNSKEAFGEFVGIVMRPPPNCSLLLKP